MSNYDVLISVFIEKIRSGELTIERVKQFYNNAPAGMQEQVMKAIETRMDSDRLMESRLFS